jgi:hypothetical protein
MSRSGFNVSSFPTIEDEDIRSTHLFVGDEEWILSYKKNNALGWILLNWIPYADVEVGGAFVSFLSLPLFSELPT